MDGVTAYPRKVLARAALLVSVVALLVSACSFGPPAEEEAGAPPRFPTPSAKPSDGGDGAVAAEPIVEGLQVPWGLDFLPDGTALVTERETRNIVAISPKLKKKKIQTIEQAYAEGEGGLMGLAVSPDYKTDKTIFIYYTTQDDNRIAKLKLGERPQPIVTGIPVSGIHNGGRLDFGPDGYLYATTGDASNTGLAQDKSSLGGKILRMTKEGKPAPGNPFKNLVYSYGHRNSQGIAWDAQQRLWSVEFGQNTWDELNQVKPGKNYGWPRVEGKGGGSKYADPLVTWRPKEASCSGAAILGDVLLTACLRGERMYVMQLNGKGGLIGAPQETLADTYGRLRTVVVAPDNTIWVTTSNLDGRGEPNPGDDKILRLVLSGDGGNSKT
ncbi:MAG: PQQ-dependent sugar dehydrogenase [Micromonosporaceae bacterium]